MCGPHGRSRPQMMTSPPRVAHRPPEPAGAPPSTSISLETHGPQRSVARFVLPPPRPEDGRVGSRVAPRCLSSTAGADSSPHSLRPGKGARPAPPPTSSRPGAASSPPGRGRSQPFLSFGESSSCPVLPWRSRRRRDGRGRKSLDLDRRKQHRSVESASTAARPPGRAASAFNPTLPNRSAVATSAAASRPVHLVETVSESCTHHASFLRPLAARAAGIISCPPERPPF